MLPKFIQDDLKGFIKGRYISEHVRLLHDVLLYVESKKIFLLCCLWSIFEKAFDSVLRTFIQKALYFSDFGSDMKQCAKAF